MQPSKNSSISQFFNSPIHYLRNRPASPAERSIELRQLLMIGQLLSMLVVTWTTGIFMWPFGILFAAILLLGHRYSARHAAHPIKRVRRIIFVALHVAFGYMMIGIAVGLPFPQGQMAMLGMALVSWEMFSRRNLYVGWIFALANLHVTAVLSRGFFFFIPLFGVGLTFLAFLWLIERLDAAENGFHPPNSTGHGNQNDDQDKQTEDDGHLSTPKSVWSISLDPFPIGPLRRFSRSFLLRLFLFGVVLFFTIPRFAGSPLVPPFTLRIPISGGPQGQIINPAVPIVQVQGTVNEGSESEYYHGFDSRLDLSYRGGLSDATMMYVRSPARSYWRSHAYDFYDGRTWVQSDADDVEIIRRTVTEPNFILDDDPPDGGRFVHTIYVVRPLPNLAYVGGSPVELFLPAEQIAVDPSGAIRLAEPLEAGMTYSVLSVSAPVDGGRLRDARWAETTVPYPEEITEKYLQLPESTTQRTRDLAAELTKDLPTTYDQVKAIEAYVKESFPYSLYPPPQMPNTDSVDQFLFIDQTGYCEHYVSAMVVMLRSQGIPARLVAGFGSGQHDPINNLYEVRAKDAHAWVEVYFPEYGWIPFEPTPGWDYDPQTGFVRNWVLSGALGGLNLPAIPFGAVGGALAAVASVIMTPLLILAGIGLLVWAARWGWQRYLTERARRAPLYSSLNDQRQPERRRIISHYRTLQKRHAAPRADTQTTQEHATDFVEKSVFEEVSHLVDVAAYRPEGPSDTEVEEALEVE